MLNENATELANIDLFATGCPTGLRIQIEGFEPFEVGNLPVPSLFGAIVQVYVIQTGNPVLYPVRFAERVVLTALDIENLLVRVRISTE